MKVMEAAELMRLVYYEKDSLDAIESADVQGMQAHILKENRVLVIEGSNEIDDWNQFNLPDIDSFRDYIVSGDGDWGDSNAEYYKGFYDYADHVLDFADPKRDQFDRIVGHSLGAAGAQIVGPRLECRTIAFASPRPLFEGSIGNSGFVLNVCRDDDPVCSLPPGFSSLIFSFGFQHIGAVEWLTRTQNYQGLNHGINKYIELLQGEASDSADKEW